MMACYGAFTIFFIYFLYSGFLFIKLCIIKPGPKKQKGNALKREDTIEDELKIKKK